MKLFITKNTLKEIEKTLRHMVQTAELYEQVIRVLESPNSFHPDTVKQAKFELSLNRNVLRHDVSDLRRLMGEL